MQVANLIGLDPGIVDTGAVWVSLDGKEKTLHANSKVWRNVTKKAKLGIEVNQQFLDELSWYVEYATTVGVPTFVFIEGYRNRGRNPQQDQKMTTLVQAIHKTLSGSVIVDNTGVKNVVTDATLSLLEMDHWDIPTHHSDIKSAARILLKGAYQHEELNSLVADLVLDRLTEKQWTLTKSLAH